MSEKKNALIVAGGRWQVPVIEFLKKENHFVFVIDPFLDSPGVALADRHIKADVRDVEGIKKLISGIKFDIVTSDQSDIAVETVAILAQHLGVKGNDRGAVKKFTNKFISRQYARELGIPVPEFIGVSDWPEVKTAIAALGLPVILKPVDSQSSRGVFKLDDGNVDRVEELTSLALKESREKFLLVEKYVDGIELTVEGICSNKKHRSLAISEKKHFRMGIASELKYPAELPSDVESAIICFNDQYVESSGLDFGITHSEYIYNSITNKICLIEIACRGGGTLISSDIAKWVSRVDLYHILYHDLIGISADVKSLPVLKRHAMLHFFEFPGGIVNDIAGLQEVAAMPGIRMIHLEFKKGDLIKPASDDRSRQGFVIILADSKKELKKKIAAVKETLTIRINSITFPIVCS